MPTRMPHDLWKTALGQLELQVTRPNFETWLGNTAGLRWEGEDQFVVGVPNDFALEWLRSRMSPLINQTVSRLLGPPVTVLFEVLGAQPAHVDQPAGTHALAASGQPHPDLIPSCTFDTFALVESNRVACEAAQRLAAGEAPYSLLLLQGPPGLGKTHLLHAIGHHAVQRGSNVVCLTGEAFVTRYGNAVRAGRPHTFRQLFDGCDLLLLDDFPFLATRAASQEQFFHIFNTLHARGARLAITLDISPASLTGISPRLLSRLHAGVALELPMPAQHERLPIVQAMASRARTDVPIDVLRLIAARPCSSVRQLEGALNRVVAFAELSQADLTAAAARQALEPFQDEPQPPTAQDILDLVCKHFRLSLDQLTSPSRARDVSYARHVAMYLLREHLSCSLAEIGSFLGGRDHTTVMNGCRRIKHERASLPETQADLNQLEAALQRRRASA